MTSFNALEFNEQRIASIMIPGPAGNIESMITQPEKVQDDTPVLVICHPHPLYAGAMTNKVVYIIAKTFLNEAITVRFNFRGVGKSEGEFDNTLGETQDLLAVVKQVQTWRPKAPLWLAGFSFGAYISFRAALQTNAEKLLLVAPAVSMYAFDEGAEISIPWVVVQGGQDEVIDARVVKDWVNRCDSKPEFIWMEQAGHFFHGKLNELSEKIRQAWT